MPQIQTDVRDAEALRAACRQLGLPEPVLGAFPVGSAVASGFAVRLPGWRYPVVCQLDTGLVQFENSHGEWGEKCAMDRFLDACAMETDNVEDRRKSGVKNSSAAV